MVRVHVARAGVKHEKGPVASAPACVGQRVRRPASPSSGAKMRYPRMCPAWHWYCRAVHQRIVDGADFHCEFHFAQEGLCMVFMSSLLSFGDDYVLSANSESVADQLVHPRLKFKSISARPNSLAGRGAVGADDGGVGRM